MNQSTAFGCALKTACKECGGALLNQADQEDGEWYHPWCSPASKRKARFRDARDRLIETAKRIGADQMRVEIADYDAAKAALRYYDL